MSIKTVIPSYLQPFTSNLKTVEVNGSTVGECLNNLAKKFPGIERMLFANNVKLHNYVGTYVNGKDTYPEELAKPVEDGDELYILYVIGGG